MAQVAYKFNVPSDQRYGLLPSAFQFDLQTGYSVLVGRNDCGKSTILQFIFKSLIERSEIANNNFCLISHDRQYISPTTQPPSTLTQYNENLFQVCREYPKPSNAAQGPNTSSLYTLLLHKSDFMSQTQKINEYLIRLGFEPIVLREAQLVKVNNIDIHLHGAGIRCVLPILAALTSPDIKVVIVDEPELSLEARAQKVLKGLLLESVDNGKIIILATQSHLFLHKSKPDKNYEITNDDKFNIKKLVNRKELFDLTYNLLGNSLEDLFFPSNFLIVEGASDQVICEKVAHLLNTPIGKVKVISARGIDNVSDSYKAIENSLIPLVADDSPYSKKVVVLLDKPIKATTIKKVKDIKKHLGNRCFVLDKSSIEEYVPESIFKKAGRDKDDDLKEIKEINNAYKYNKGEGAKKLKSIKKEISSAIVNALELKDLEKIPIITDSVKLALKKA